MLISGFVSHLEQDWEDPRHALFLQRLGAMGRLIRFDKRGTGMSDRPSGIPDLETRMHDVLAVMDAAGSRRAVVVGYSEGGPMAILLAAMHPSRVSALVLYGSYARRTWAPDYPYAHTAAERAVYTETLVTGWDWEADMRMRNPIGGRRHAAVVGPSDAGRCDPGDRPGADEHERLRRRPRGAPLGPGPDAGAAQEGRRALLRRRGGLPRRAHPRRHAAHPRRCRPLRRR